jgi:FtsZ-binding cell division protein ZapB
MESLIEHYRSLSLEKESLQTTRTSLEREASSIRDEVREAVDANLTLKNQLSSQSSLVQRYFHSQVA